MSRRQVWFLIAVGAILLVTSYPPFALVPLTPALSFIALIPAVLLVAQAAGDAAPRRAFTWGLWYGFASQSLVLYWLINNVLQIAQQWHVNRMLEKEAALAAAKRR